MKFRALKTNYCNEADSATGLTTPRSETLLIKAGAYLLSRISRIESSNRFNVSAFPDSLSALALHKLKKKNQILFRIQIDSVIQLSYTEPYEAIPNNFRIEKLLTNSIFALSHNIARTISSAVQFLLLHTKVIAIASNINDKIMVLSSTNDDFISSTGGKMLLDMAYGITLDPKSQRWRSVGKVDDDNHQLSVRQKK